MPSEKEQTALSVLKQIERQWTELYSYCLDNHQGYDNLFRAALIFEDSRLFERAVEEIRGALR